MLVGELASDVVVRWQRSDLCNVTICRADYYKLTPFETPRVSCSRDRLQSMPDGTMASLRGAAEVWMIADPFAPR